MNREQARALVRNTLGCSFDRDRFTVFLRELLNRFDESKAQRWPYQYVRDAYKPHVRRFERFGTFVSRDGHKVDLLAIYLSAEAKLERARTALRNFVADYLKTRGEKDAALAAFVAPAEKTWRFSYIRMEYATTQDGSGRIGVRTDLTPARRFSYLVGEGESCHTAQAQFLSLLEDEKADPALENLEAAFSVEAVSDEFFLRYAGLFAKVSASLIEILKNDAVVREEFQAKSVSTVEFAKKLLGQIVFLYFLQKKGWLGVPKGEPWGAGPRDFLRRLADGNYGAYGNLFNEVLEPLFYDTLATDRGRDAWCDQFRCRIPFLNGGLFEPLSGYDWEKTDLLLPNELFTNREVTKEGDVGTGVLDVFDRYNFTVSEAEPLEKDVAVDPEMLGKVFEKLIEENRRKGLGAFYTPREIVHYICQEALINYLDTMVNGVSAEVPPAAPGPTTDLFGRTEPQQLQLDRQDQDVVSRQDLEALIHYGEQAADYGAAIADGTQEKTYRGKTLPATVREHARLIDGKLHDITVCDPAVGSGAFPVGMMQEIARARMALTPYFNTAEPRNAYVFKRHAIHNSLYGVDIDGGAVEIAKLRLWLSLVVDEEETQQIKPLPNLDYKVVAGDSLLGFPYTTEGLTELENLKASFFDEVERPRKEALKRKIDAKLRAILSRSKAQAGHSVDFEFRLFFSEVFHRGGGFDVVLGNPPYIRQEKLRDLKPALKNLYETFTGSSDIYVYFYERGLQILRPDGCLVYISSNSFLTSGFGEKLRAFLAQRARVGLLVDFAETGVFQAITEPCILLVIKGSGDGEAARILKWDESQKLENIWQTVHQRGSTLQQKELTPDGWRLEPPAVLRLLRKLRGGGTPLAEYVGGRFFYGIKTGFNEAFCVDRATRDRLIAEHPSSAAVLKPYLRGRDVRRWYVEPKDLWLIFTRRGTDIKSYPAIEGHLKQFRQQLEPRPKGWDVRKDWPGRKPGSYRWYEIQDDVAYWHEFAKPKIVYQDIARHYGMAWDDGGLFLSNTCYFVPGVTKSLLAILMSSTTRFFAQKTLGSAEGGFIRLFSIHVAKFPVPPFPPDKGEELASLVTQILAAKRADPVADVLGLEREIDTRVYQLYGLNKEEIDIVEEVAGGA